MTQDTFQTILHVEDSETDALIVKRALRGMEDVGIDWVPTGAEGLEKARQADYDLILLDYALPDMTGLEVLVRLSQRKPDVPVVMVSGFGSEYVAVRGLNLGALGYVNKDTEEFKQNLPELLTDIYKEGQNRRRAREIGELVKQRPSLRRQIEDVLSDLREVLPSARGAFVASLDGLPVATSKTDGRKDVDVLSSMGVSSLLKNLDVVGGTLQLAEQQGGIVHYGKGSLIFHRIQDMGSLVVILERAGSWRDDGKEAEQAVREIEEVILQ